MCDFHWHHYWWHCKSTLVTINVSSKSTEDLYYLYYNKVVLWNSLLSSTIDIQKTEIQLLMHSIIIEEYKIKVLSYILPHSTYLENFSLQCNE